MRKGLTFHDLRPPNAQLAPLIGRQRLAGLGIPDLGLRINDNTPRGTRRAVHGPGRHISGYESNRAAFGHAVTLQKHSNEVRFSSRPRVGVISFWRTSGSVLAPAVRLYSLSHLLLSTALYESFKSSGHKKPANYDCPLRNT